MRTEDVESRREGFFWGLKSRYFLNFIYFVDIHSSTVRYSMDTSILHNHFGILFYHIKIYSPPPLSPLSRLVLVYIGTLLAVDVTPVTPSSGPPLRRLVDEVHPREVGAPDRPKTPFE